MESKAALLKQLKAYHQRSNERFKRWQASGYRHEFKLRHEPMPDAPPATLSKHQDYCLAAPVSVVWHLQAMQFYRHQQHSQHL